MDTTYKDKIIWITGASSGIGESLTYALAEAGARLAISSRNEKELERVKNNCPKETEILIAPLDVADFERVPEVARRVLDHYGYLDYLVANAGISHRDTAANTSLEVDRKIMDVNYFGAIAVTKAVLPSFIRQQFGHIVVISSVMGKLGAPWRSAYAASKHALHGFYDSLRAELDSDNIKVSILIPGYVNTNVTINALKGDGSRHSVKADTTAAGLDPDAFARKALRAIAAGKREALIGHKEVLAVYVKRFAPGVMANILKNMELK